MQTLHCPPPPPPLGIVGRITSPPSVNHTSSQTSIHKGEENETHREGVTIAAAATAIVVAVIDCPGPNDEEVEITCREDHLSGRAIRLPAGTANRPFLDKLRPRLVGVL